MARIKPERWMPTVWLNLPLVPTATYSRGEIERPVNPICIWRGSQPESTTLRVPPTGA